MRALDAHVAELQGMPASMPNSDAARGMSDAEIEALAEKLAVGEACQAAARDRRDSDLAEAEEERATIDVPERDAGAAYFVLFGTLVAAATARQTFQAAAVKGLVSAAPPPEEVNWAALQPAAAGRVVAARLVAHVAFLALLFFFSIPVRGEPHDASHAPRLLQLHAPRLLRPRAPRPPCSASQVTFVSSLMALDQLEKTFPFLGVVLNWLGPDVRTFLTAFLPRCGTPDHTLTWPHPNHTLTSPCPLASP